MLMMFFHHNRFSEAVCFSSPSCSHLLKLKISLEVNSILSMHTSQLKFFKDFFELLFFHGMFRLIFEINKNL